jgi:polyphosphate kinase 2 (PPK2 family)
LHRGGSEALSADGAALRARIDDGRKIWKLSDMDLKSYSRWNDYTRARDEMFLASDTAWAPWYVVHSDKKSGRG